MITLYSNDLTETINLPKELIWTDEFDWGNIVTQHQYSINGDLVIESFTRGKGRPITLSGDNAVLKRQDILNLYSWTNIPNHAMVLTLHDNRDFDVLFRHWEAPVLVANTPFGGYADPQDEFYYSLEIKLVHV